MYKNPKAQYWGKNTLFRAGPVGTGMCSADVQPIPSTQQLHKKESAFKRLGQQPDKSAPGQI